MSHFFDFLIFCLIIKVIGEDLENISNHLKLGRTSVEVMGFIKLIHSIIKAQVKRHFDPMEKNSR